MSTFLQKSQRDNEFSFRGSCPGTHCIGDSASKILRAAMNERMASGWALALRVTLPTSRRADVQPLASIYLPRLRKLVVFALLFIALTGAANADLPVATVTTRTSHTTVQVAEPFTFELTVTAPAGSRVDFPSIGASLGEFDVTDQLMRTDVPSENDVNQRTWTQQLTLESIVTGDLEIPSLEIQVRRDADIQTLKTEAVPVRVASVLEDRADPTKFRDIQSVVDIATPEPVSRAWVWWTLGGCGGITAAALLFVAAAKRKTWMTPPSHAPKPVISTP